LITSCSCHSAYQYVKQHTESSDDLHAEYRIILSEKDNGGPLLPVSQTVQQPADTMNIGRVTVRRIANKFMGCWYKGNSLSSPGKCHEKTKTMATIGRFGQDAIHRHIYQYYTQSNIPT